MVAMRTSRQSRVLRGTAAASVATFVALLSHVAGGGGIPGWLGIVTPWVLSVWVSTLLAGRRLSVWRLSLSVAASQVLFHALFVLGTTPTSNMELLSGHAGHAGHGAHTAMIMTSPSATDTMHLMHADPLMWFWHGVAAVVTIAVLYRGERLLLSIREITDQIVAWVRQRFDPIPARVRVLPSLRIVPTDAERLLIPGPQLSPLCRRGPPSQRVI